LKANLAAPVNYEMSIMAIGICCTIRQGADIESKVEELNQSLTNRDKMKDDAIA
jgi:hypothetical protein